MPGIGDTNGSAFRSDLVGLGFGQLVAREIRIFGDIKKYMSPSRRAHVGTPIPQIKAKVAINKLTNQVFCGV